MDFLKSMTAAAMAAGVRSKRISPVELAQAHLDRIERLHSQLNAFVHVRAELTLAEAGRSEQRAMRNEATGLLEGVPISIKNSIDVAGYRCEAGSRLRAGNVPAEDATLVARLRAAGAVILGVTNAPEMLMAWETDNLLYGRTNNPWDLERTAGGSSGGEAAAIASGCSAGGVGSDGGGSIREPAHFSGICGLKPTPGRVPSSGHFPKSGGPFALLGVVGPMARTVEDLSILFEVMQGADDGDPCSAPVPLCPISEPELRNTRIGFFEDDGRTPVTAETRAAVKSAALALSSSGLTVENFRPTGLEESRQLWWQLFGIAGNMLLGPMLRDREDDISPMLLQFMSWSGAERPHTGESLLATWLGRDEVRERVLAQMRNFPVLLCPVAAIPAFRHGERSWKVEGKTVEYLDAWSYTEWFNLLGFPAVAVPWARSAEGLPIGVQIVGRPWEEERVLAVAAHLESLRGPWIGPSMEWADETLPQLR